MTKKTIIRVIIILLVVVLTVVGYILFTKDNQKVSQTAENQQTVVADTTNTENQPIAQENTQPQEPAPAKATYISYDSGVVANTSGTKILFFHAPWCPQCRELDSDITKNISNDNGVTIFKVDYDTNQALRQKYGVTIQTTLVKIDDNGNLVEKYVAYQDPTYANVKSNLY
jgi:thiol-disulfide isomerase/thioredoxin